MTPEVPPRHPVETVPSVCPHDCTSTCALEVERVDARTIGRVRGSLRNTYTRGVICEKVARYAERTHHPERLMHPLKRLGPKGSGRFARIPWDDALDMVAQAFIPPWCARSSSSCTAGWRARTCSCASTSSS